MRAAHALRTLAIVAAVALVGPGCGSDDTGAGGSPASSSSSAGSGGAGGDPTPPESCVQAGEVGNAIGVGTYCTPLGKECEGSGAPLCLAFASPSDKQWFCTKLGCKMNEDCGDDAVCLTSEQVPACVPTKCFEGGSGGAGGTGGAGGAAGGGIGGHI